MAWQLGALWLVRCAALHCAAANCPTASQLGRPHPLGVGPGWRSLLLPGAVVASWWRSRYYSRGGAELLAVLLAARYYSRDRS
jgi:hypothetical protein